MMLKLSFTTVLTFMFNLACTNVAAQPAIDTVSIQADFGRTLNGPLKPFWAFWGYDEPNYTYMKDGRKLLSEFAALSPVPVYVRVHNLLTTGPGEPSLKWGSTNVYTEDAHGKPVYSWKIIDSIFDTFIQRGMHPIAQIGFMPEALSIKPESDKFQETPDHKKIYHYTGWSYPPSSYEKFADLVFEWVKHSIARYGVKEVEQWYWEVWNEPDIGYWKGTTEEYIKLYDYSADAVKRALPTAKIGGPETTNPGTESAALFLKSFLTHIVSGRNYITGKVGTPLDFITFHAKGDPKLVDGVVRMDIGKQLRHIDKGFEIVASYPALKKLPIIIGESDPEGCAACSEDVYPHNAYRNGTMYSSYTAASFARIYDLVQKHSINLRGAVTWAFEFENQPWFHGFRDMATNGVDKPVLNVFRMFGMMAGDRVYINENLAYNSKLVIDSGVRGNLPDVNALAAKSDHAATVMVWNYHDDNKLDLASARVSLKLKGLDAKKLLFTHYRIDQEHSNAFTAWKKMGSPKNPDEEQLAVLEKAGQLEMLHSPEWIQGTNGDININFDLPRQGISLLRFTW